jgi:sec-independent protein translocase protein TatA
MLYSKAGEQGARQTPTRLAEKRGPRMFGSLGGTELIIILVIVLVLFGAGKLAGVGGAVGTSIREFRDGMEGKSKDEPAQEQAATGDTKTS